MWSGGPKELFVGEKKSVLGEGGGAISEIFSVENVIPDRTYNTIIKKEQ